MLHLPHCTSSTRRPSVPASYSLPTATAEHGFPALLQHSDQAYQPPNLSPQKLQNTYSLHFFNTQTKRTNLLFFSHSNCRTRTFCTSSRRRPSVPTSFCLATATAEHVLPVLLEHADQAYQRPHDGQHGSVREAHEDILSSHQARVARVVMNSQT